MDAKPDTATVEAPELAEVDDEPDAVALPEPEAAPDLAEEPPEVALPATPLAVPVMATG